MHDPALGRTARQTAASPGWLGWLRRRFAARRPAPAPAAEPVGTDDERPGLEALACTLAELIAAAQLRVDGAATLIGRSAEEAQAYRQALSGEAEALAGPGLGDVAAGLIEVTRAMIERTRRAEVRLRAAGEELASVQTDLVEARAAAERDPLTNLPNRRALQAALARAVATAHAADRALSLAFCDIDHFKKLNDSHGHALGDRVLRLVGDGLAEEGGDGVFVGRQGGEEFVMLFEGVGADQAAVRVDAIRARLAARSLRSRTSEAPIGRITFSAGVAMLGPGETDEGLLVRADRALYRAKHAGRNRVEIDRLP